MYAIFNIKEPLLGRPAIEALKIVTVHPDVHDTENIDDSGPYNSKKEIRKIFQDFGILDK